MMVTNASFNNLEALFIKIYILYDEQFWKNNLFATKTSCRLQGGRPSFDGQMDRMVSLKEIQKHNKVDNAWIVIDGKVKTTV